MGEYHLEYTESAKLGISRIMRDPVAFEDFKKALRSIRKSGVRFGKPLENKLGMDLRGCYKVFIGNRAWRIIYSQNGSNIMIITILTVAEREDLKAYHEAFAEYKKILVEK